MQLTYLFVAVSLAFATLVSGHVRNRGHMGAVSGHGHVDPMSCLDVDASKEPNLQLWRCLPWPNTHQVCVNFYFGRSHLGRFMCFRFGL
ncbi:hypothetical protein BKA69DRAFT_1099701 [Paraphysoderma sedebokerense]|nr:hypothetical protein BKA69DRAFT_1099701 [Paraphysoderma sedebokerense]